MYVAAAQGATQIPDTDTTYRAVVVQVLGEKEVTVPNTDAQELVQTIKVRITSGDKVGTMVTLDDDTFKSVVGDELYIRYLKTSDGTEYYSTLEPNRLTTLLYLVILFCVVIVIFGGRHGVQSLLALVISFGGVFTFLFPKLLTTTHPVLLAVAITLATLCAVMFLTHGFSRITLAAFLGCSVSVLITLTLAEYAVKLAKLSGFSDDASVYLNLMTNGTLNFQALLVAAIIIGVIGVVDDVAITQASVVQELLRANSSLSKLDLYRRAMRVGKDHSAALINTLVLAYAGASLPLLLLLYTSDTPFLELINREAVATEIIRTVVGSIGLVILVPCATAIAVFLMKKEGEKSPPSSYSHIH